MLEQELKKSLERAKQYIDIVNSIGKEGISKEEQYNWLTRNSIPLAKEMRKLGYNTKTISTFPGYFESGFPPMLGKHLISATQTSINGYIQEIEETLKNKDKLEELSNDFSRYFLQ